MKLRFLILFLLPVTLFGADISTTILSTQPSALKGYWKCNELTGNVLHDSSGNSKDLTIQGVIGVNYWLAEQGVTGSCFRTDGAVGYATRGDAVIPSLDGQNFTEFAFFQGGSDFAAGCALSVTNSGTFNDRICMGKGSGISAGGGQCRGNGLTMNSPITGGTAFDGNWHSVAFKRSGTTFTLYVDGLSVATATATLFTGSTSNKTNLMHSIQSTTTAFAKGSVQHAAIWNATLSDAEILAIHNSAFTGESIEAFKVGTKSHVVYAPSWLTTGVDTIYFVSSGGILSPVTIGANMTFTGGTLNSTGGGGSFTPPTGTGFIHVTSGTMDGASVAETGTDNVVRATSPVITDVTLLELSNASNKNVIYGRRFTDTSPAGNFITFDNAADTIGVFTIDVFGEETIKLDANNTVGLTIKRKTNTSPTGKFLDFQNASAASVFTIDITGNMTVGTVPEARITWTDPNADSIRMWDDTDNAMVNAAIGSGLTYTHSTHTLSSSGGAPINATYITETADGTLSNEFALGSLGTGILKNTATTGIPSIAAAGTDYEAALGNPGTNGFILSSTTSGTRSWVAKPVRTHTISATWRDLSGATLATGSSIVPATAGYTGTIVGWAISSDGTPTVRWWQKADGTAIPTVSDNINTSTGFALATGTHIKSTDFTGANAISSAVVTAGDMFIGNLVTVGSATWVKAELFVTEP